jgi:hypothetical protein
MTKIARSGSASGSISQRHGSADPDPHQNAMDLEHFLPVSPAFSFSTKVFVLFTSRSGRSRSLADPEGGLPTVEAFQRHELTLLRIEDTLNHDWGSAAGKSGQDSPSLFSCPLQRVSVI